MHQHRRAGSQFEGDGPANAARRSGYDGRLPCEFTHADFSYPVGTIRYNASELILDLQSRPRITDKTRTIATVLVQRLPGVLNDDDPPRSLIRGHRVYYARLVTGAGMRAI